MLHLAQVFIHKLNEASVFISKIILALFYETETQAIAAILNRYIANVILAIIVSTGFVSNFVQVDYTTGMAHAMYNGFTILPSTEANHHLHGEVVSYGILVMLTVDKQYEERDKIYAFNRSIGLPTCLKDIDAALEDLPAVTDKALKGIDVRVWPYTVDQQMLIDGVMELEEYDRERKS